jgi:AcrR family transcriptional regulator
VTLASEHRERLLEGLAASIRERGFWGTKVADIVGHARTSRRTFYECFDDKDACFLELVDRTADALIEHVESAVDPSSPWVDQVDQAVDSYIEALMTDPAMTVTLTRELPALGERGMAAQRAAIERFAELCVRLVDTEEFRRAGIPALGLDSALMLTGGLNQMIVHVVERGDSVDSIAPVAKDVIKAVLSSSAEVRS